MAISWRLLWFAVAGGIGFIVDAGIVQAFFVAGADPRAARFVSVPAAIVATWLINRRHTFADRAGPPSLREFVRYLGASLVALSVNLALFIVLVTWVELFQRRPVLAVAVATAVSMSINFLSYFRLVFAK